MSNPYAPPTTAEPPVLIPQDATDDITVQFCYSGEYLSQALKRFYRQRRKTIPVMFLLGITLLLVIMAILMQPIGIKLLLLAAAATVMLAQALAIHLVKGALKKTPIYNQQLTMLFTDQGFRAEHVHQQTTTKWTLITECVRMKDGFMLLQGPNQFHWVPDTAISNENGVERLAKILRHHVVNYREC